MRLAFSFALALGVVYVAGCSSSQPTGGKNEAGTSASSDAQHDAPTVTTPDAHATHDSGHGMDASTKDANAPEDVTTRPDVATLPDAGSHPDAMPDAHADAETAVIFGDSGINSLLALPSADAATCTPVGNIVVCPIGNCLVANPTSTGRCQTCQGQGMCEGHKGTACTGPEGCDIGWACYDGKCTLFCNLDAGVGNCAFPSTCTSVGNAYEGVCLP